jgi:arylsulfatase A-like enzyme
MTKRSFRPTPWIVAALVVAALLVGLRTLLDSSAARPTDPGDPRPIGTIDDLARFSERGDTNVLFILIDTLRAHRLHVYGYERETSPTMDYLAASGVVFARHLSQSSWTKCSMASMWTGFFPSRTRVLRFDHVVPSEATMPAEIFRDAGFRTAGIWRNGWIAANFGFDQGFEVYERPIPRPPPPSLRRSSPNLTLQGSDDDIVDAAIEFLRVHGRERWFLYLHMMDVHQYLYDEQSALFGTSISDLYDNSIRHEDAIVARLMWHLAETGHLDDTLIVLSSDHGEAFGERGFEGHAKQVYGETTEVPFILNFPFLLEPGVAVPGRTRNVDVWPTVLDLVGLPPLPPGDGRSLVPDILAAAEGKPMPGETAYAQLDGSWGKPKKTPEPLVAVADGPLRFVSVTEPTGQVREQLFDRQEDPHELRNLFAERPEDVERMRGLVKSYLEAPPADWGDALPTVELDEMQLNQLRALGYAVP